MSLRRDPNLPGDSAGWDVQKAWFEALRNKLPNGGMPPPAPAPGGLPSPYVPAALSRPPVPYPDSPYAAASSTTGGRGGGGGGGGGGGMPAFAGPYLAVEPSTSMGAGSYWPGHSQEFAKQIQGAIMGGPNAMAGMTDQPAVMAAMNAWNARNNLNPNARRMAGGVGSPFGINAGGGGGGGLAGGFQNAHDRANQANEARYDDILRGQQARYERGMGYLANQGAQQKADLNKAYDAQQATGNQSLVSRGLGASTITNTMTQGVERERQNSLNRLQESLNQQYLATDAGLSGDVLNFMERKTESGPDFGQLAALAQLAGSAGAGQPGGVGGGSGAVMAYSPAGGGGGGFIPVPMPMGGGGGGGGGGFGNALAAAGVTPQQIRAAHVRANNGDAGAQAWLRMLEQKLAGAA